MAEHLRLLAPEAEQDAERSRCRPYCMVGFPAQYKNLMANALPWLWSVIVVYLRCDRCVRISLPRFSRLRSLYCKVLWLQIRNHRYSAPNNALEYVARCNAVIEELEIMARFPNRGRGSRGRSSGRGRGGMRGAKAPQKVQQRRRERFESSRIDTFE